ncbi:hypothetical protein HBA55_00360 [Pseudomaricurvus alkylphenolicus]|uniref:Zn-ribbon domain-containing OB-fold protein n=1 Tax=Pseudomaricurvus alkylphenolicus TaxID=1306991 RepID=UPI00141FDA8F|nr:OB-fold domain-containing protein [Pseudomaricurvus alkylphenolicus]NIB38011.1 hypothetical protein [Pseudomaricurvus alkylphenolicus]
MNPQDDQVPAVRRPDPMYTAESAFFWEAAERGELMAQQCQGCQQYLHPPRPMCPECLSMDLQPTQLSGRGKVYSVCSPQYPQIPAFDYPLLTALIDLEEGIRLLSNLVDVELESVQPGMPVEVCFAATVGGRAVPQFRPEGNK